MSSMQKRLNRARCARMGYRQANGHHGPPSRHRDDLQDELTDLVADVLHLAHHEGFDTARLLRCAEDHFSAERG